MVRGESEHRGEEVAGEWRKLCRKELHETVRVTRSRTSKLVDCTKIPNARVWNGLACAALFVFWPYRQAAARICCYQTARRYTTETTVFLFTAVNQISLFSPMLSLNGFEQMDVR